MNDYATRLGGEGPDRERRRGQPVGNRPVRVSLMTHGLLGSLLAALGTVTLLLAPEETDRLGREAGPVRLVGDGMLVSALSFSPDGRTMAVGYTGGKLRLWELATQRSRAVRINQSVVSSVVFAPDGRTVVLADQGSSIHRYDPATLEPLPTLHSPGFRFATLCFSHDGRTLAAGDLDGRSALWDPARVEIRAVLEGHQGMIGALVFSHDDRTLASGGGIDGTIRLWDASSGRPTKILPGHRSIITAASMYRVISMAFSPDDRELVSGGGFDQFVRLWNTRTGRALEAWRLSPSGNSVSYVAFTTPRAIPDGLLEKSIARATLRQRTTGGGTVVAGHSSSAMRLAMTHDGRHLAVGSWSDVLVWKLEQASPQ